MNAGDLGPLAEEINGLIGAWEEFGYADPPAPGCAPVPPLGERSAAAIRAGHQAVEGIDRLTRRLYEVREQLVTELRENSDILGRRIDERLASRREARDPAI